MSQRTFSPHRLTPPPALAPRPPASQAVPKGWGGGRLAQAAEASPILPLPIPGRPQPDPSEAVQLACAPGAGLQQESPIPLTTSLDRSLGTSQLESGCCRDQDVA